jgi:hypothetical protein
MSLERGRHGHDVGGDAEQAEGELQDQRRARRPRRQLDRPISRSRSSSSRNAPCRRTSRASPTSSAARFAKEAKPQRSGPAQSPRYPAAASRDCPWRGRGRRFDFREPQHQHRPGDDRSLARDRPAPGTLPVAGRRALLRSCAVAAISCGSFKRLPVARTRAAI